MEKTIGRLRSAKMTAVWNVWYDALKAWRAAQEKKARLMARVQTIIKGWIQRQKLRGLNQLKFQVRA